MPSGREVLKYKALWNPWELSREEAGDFQDGLKRPEWRRIAFVMRSEQDNIRDFCSYRS